jgi:membrane-associated protease RseP (regulator of RpoE activity)
MYATEKQDFTPYVNEVMAIDDITLGNSKDPYLVRYRGKIRGDSAEAYDRLAGRLRPQGITPLFRKDHDTQVVLLVDGVLDPKPSNPVVNLVLFILTLVSVIFAGSLNTFTGPANSASEYILGLIRNMPNGLPFAASLLAILLAHEFGHYLAGRFHKTYVTLPYFIPFPLSPFGTMGAFIQLKEPPKNRRILLDIGIAGPLAGLVVAIPVLLLGLALSKVEVLSPIAGQGVQMEGNSVLYLLAKFAIFGQILPHPASYGNISPILYWVRYFFTGQPFPWGGVDVVIHPIAFAGWAGLLVTALNLIPAGQLDGGHVLYVLLGQKARALLPVILVALVLLGFVWVGWWLWAFLIFLLGRLYAEPLDQITPLNMPRKAIAILGLVIFFLVFTPIPLIAVMAG